MNIKGAITELYISRPLSKLFTYYSYFRPNIQKTLINIWYGTPCYSTIEDKLNTEEYVKLWVDCGVNL